MLQNESQESVHSMYSAYLDRVNILGVGVSASNIQQTVATMADWIEQDIRKYVVTCNVYTVMLCRQDPILRAVVNQAGLTTPDGMPLVILSRTQGRDHVRQVSGTDLMVAFSDIAAKRGYRQFYYGGAPGVPEKVAETLTRQFPHLQVAGTFSPPFHNMVFEEDEAVVAEINASKPDVVWVGLGSPKQDFWIANHRRRLDTPVLVGVGAAFDFLSGQVPRAPLWMRKMALEWFFRLMIEPRRLWRRYLIYNPLFAVHVLGQLMGVKSYPLD